MKHWSKRLLSILLCLVLMLSLVPAAYAVVTDVTQQQMQALLDDYTALFQKLEAENDPKTENIRNVLGRNITSMQGYLQDFSSLEVAQANDLYDGYNQQLSNFKSYLAKLPKSEASGKIDLTPAYEAKQNLYAALGILGEAHFYKNAITGIRDLVNGTALPGSAKESLKTGAVSKLVEKLNVLATAKPTDDAYKYGSSYYGLAKKVAPDVVAAYNTVGQAVVGNIAENIAGNTDSSMVGGVMTQVGGIVGSFA